MENPFNIFLSKKRMGGKEVIKHQILEYIVNITYKKRQKVPSKRLNLQIGGYFSLTPGFSENK